jgi:hypothetical protein
MAARGVRFILLCGLNRENQREGAYLSPTSNVTVVTLSYDGRPSAAVMQRILNNEILHLSGSWTDSIFMGPIPSVFQVILFCAGAAQYPNALALQSLASKLHPKGCLYIQLQSFTQREEGDITIKDPGLEFVYEQDGFRHYAVCYTPPWTLHEALPEGQFGMSVTMACHDPFWKNLTPWENAYAEFLRSRCREHGITFVLCLWRTMGVLFHQYRPKTFSSTIYNTINQSRPEGILQFDKTPIATIWRGSPENPPEDD